MLPDYQDAPIFDEASALSFLEHDRELLDEVVALFRKTARRILEELETQLESGDVESFVRGAHSLKGAAANIAAERIRIIALDLESKGSDLPERGAASFQPHLGALLEELDNFDALLELA